MPRTGRPGLSAQQKKELWIRWKDGQSLSEIGRSLGKHAGSIHGVLSASGGIAPRERRRRPDALTVLEREEISRSLATGRSLRAIASQLGRSPSTICIENLGGLAVGQAGVLDFQADLLGSAGLGMNA